jgi:AcrR family transcriptional regulator
MDETLDWKSLYPHLLALEEKGLVTRTFRRLDPERQQAVLDAILAEAAEHGPAELNIKSIAARAGVAVGSLYQYFGSREGLLNFTVEIVVRTTVDLFDMSRPYLVAMPLQEALTAYLSYGIEWSQTQGPFVRFFARAAYGGDPDLGARVVRPIADVMRVAVEEMLAHAQARGEVRADVDIAAAARVVNALLIAVGDAQLLPYLNTYFQVTAPDVSPERALTAAVTLILHGISPPPAPPAGGARKMRAKSKPRKKAA